MIFDSIKNKIKPCTIIPQPISKGYKVKGYGRSRGEEALVGKQLIGGILAY